MTLLEAPLLEKPLANLMTVTAQSLLFDEESTEIHRRGLLQMVATRGGLNNLGFEGFLAELSQKYIIASLYIFIV
jgi:hypothetical protein